MAKPTNKERDQQLQWLTSQIANLQRIVGSYIEFKDDSADFQKHLIDLNEELKKKAKDDTSNTSKMDIKKG